jgi:hypothetical protein
MKVVVLGAGPAGLLAALAVKHAGHVPILVSRPEKSPVLGLQYLHSAIPGLTLDGDSAVIDVVKRGTRDGYAEKVYGNPAAPCSWDTIPEGEHRVWNLRDAYDLLWYAFRITLNSHEVGPGLLSSLCESSDLIISTIPAKDLCWQPYKHEFSQEVVRVSQASIPGVDATSQTDHHGVVIYNGTIGDPWYRYSQIFGIDSWEYPAHHNRLPRTGLLRKRLESRLVTKPLATDCDCWANEENFVPLGRYGQWKKDVLLHDVYWGAKEAVMNHVV